MNKIRVFLGIGLAIVLIGLGGWLVLRRDRAQRCAIHFGDVVAVKEMHESWLMDLPGVVGVGVGDCDAQPGIKVHMNQHVAGSERPIPKELDGFKTDILVSGPIKPRVH